MHRIPALLSAALASCAATSSAPQKPLSPADVSTARLIVSQRYLDQDDWEPLDEPTAFNVEFDSYGRFDPVGYEIGFSYSEDSGSISGGDVDAETWEVYAGARKTFSLAEDHLHPYIGVGASWSATQLEPDGGSSLEDNAFGFYLRGGVYWTFDGGLSVGADYRMLLGVDYEDAGAEADGDFSQVGVVLGYSF